MQLNVNKTGVISFSPSLSPTCPVLITNFVNRDCIIDLGVVTDSKLFPSSSGLHIFSDNQVVEVNSKSSLFLSTGLLMLYCTVKVGICFCYVELHYFYWCKIEHIQLNFLSLCHRHIFNNTECNYVNVQKVHEISKFKCPEASLREVFQYFFLRVWKVSTFVCWIEIPGALLCLTLT
jgi:hypothetical protein